MINAIVERERIQSSEGYAQYLLASLILGARPPGYNKPAPPSTLGQKLLALVYERAFKVPLADTLDDFFWEYCLPSMRDEDPDRWPDLAATSASRLVLFELKTLPGSIREGQVDEQIRLGRHNFPNKDIEMIYVTADPVEGAPPLESHCAYANLTWAEISRCVRALWHKATGPEGDLARQFVDYLDDQYPGLTAESSLGAQSTLASDTSHPGDQLLNALFTALDVEANEKSSAVEFPGASPQEAARFRDAIKEMLSEYNQRTSVPLTHVRPWVWQSKSMGEAITEQGKQIGVEVRLSYYK